VFAPQSTKLKHPNTVVAKRTQKSKNLDIALMSDGPNTHSRKNTLKIHQLCNIRSATSHNIEPPADEHIDDEEEEGEAMNAG
jgi:hypothetical protein